MKEEEAQVSADGLGEKKEGWTASSLTSGKGAWKG